MRTRLIVGLATVLIACNGAGETFGPSAALLGDEIGGLQSELRASLEVGPADVNQHGAFTVRITVTNPTADTIRVTTSDSCLYDSGVLRGGTRVPFQGSNYGCYQAFTTHVFPPGYSLIHTRTMRAEYFSRYVGEVDGAPAPKGLYVVQVQFKTPGRPVVGRSLHVY